MFSDVKIINMFHGLIGFLSVSYGEDCVDGSFIHGNDET